MEKFLSNFESALSYYGLIPETTHGIVAVTTRKTTKIKNKVGIFYYHHVKPLLFRDFVRIEMDGYRINIALPEKALLDYFYLRNLKPEELGGLRLQNLETLDVRRLISLSTLFLNG